MAYFDTTENLKIFNSADNTFHFTERERGRVELFLNQKDSVTLEFEETSVKVFKAYRYDGRSEMVKIIRFIRYYSDKNGFKISRTNSDFWGELRLHTALYKMGYREEHTLNAEIDFDKDDRWYVNVVGKVLGWIGI